MESWNRVQAKIGRGGVPRAKSERSSTGKVIRIGEKQHRVNDVESLVLLGRRREAGNGSWGVQVLLIWANARTVLRIPRLSRNADEIGSRSQMAKTIAPEIVGCRLANHGGATRTPNKIFAEEHDLAVPN